MNAKSYLKMIQKLDLKIKNKQMEIASLYDLLDCAAIAPKEVNVQTSGGKDQFAETIAKIVDMRNELIEEANEYLNIKFQAIQIINSMENDESKFILMRRYLNYQEWGDIADEMGYTRQTINNKHGKALLEFEKVLTRFDAI